MKYAFMAMTLLFALLGLFSCAANYTGERNIVKYDIELIQVRKTANINQRLKAPVADTTDAALTRYVFEDDLLRSVWSADEAGWDVQIINKTEKPIMIDWDNASYMDYDNVGHSVLISATKYSDREKPQTPTVITRKGTLTEKLISATHIYQSPLTGLLVKRPLMPVDFTEASRYKGKELRMMLPFTVEGLSSQYEFIFKVKDVRQVVSSNNPWGGYQMDRALGSGM